MHVISKKALSDFYAVHDRARDPMLAWHGVMAKSTFANFGELRRAFNSVDRVGDFHVFDIAGNHYCVICAIHFDAGRVYIRHVLTHNDYNRWRPA